VALSANRAKNVSEYITDLGVQNFIVDQDALGETNLAVKTGDGVKAQANRRVAIQFIQ
jgi:outer membrane protein OmpA-like peptidoglycan-associated protein